MFAEENEKLEYEANSEILIPNKNMRNQFPEFFRTVPLLHPHRMKLRQKNFCTRLISTVLSNIK